MNRKVSLLRGSVNHENSREAALRGKNQNNSQSHMEYGNIITMKAKNIHKDAYFSESEMKSEMDSVIKLDNWSSSFDNSRFVNNENIVGSQI